MGKIQEWYDAWLLEQAKEAVASSFRYGQFNPRLPKYKFPADIVMALRMQAEDCERSELILKLACHLGQKKQPLSGQRLT
jgi:hypothetical protein